MKSLKRYRGTAHDTKVMLRASSFGRFTKNDGSNAAALPS
jgi:hypothetical protein